MANGNGNGWKAAGLVLSLIVLGGSIIASYAKTQAEIETLKEKTALKADAALMDARLDYMQKSLDEIKSGQLRMEKKIDDMRDTK